MNSPYQATNYAVLGLPDHTPWDVLARIERTPVPMSPKELAAQRNREQARARYHANKLAAEPVPLHSLSKRPRTAREKTIHALRDNTGKSIAIASQADADRNARIKGRAL